MSDEHPVKALVAAIVLNSILFGISLLLGSGYVFSALAAFIVIVMSIFVISSIRSWVDLDSGIFALFLIIFALLFIFCAVYAPILIFCAVNHPENFAPYHYDQYPGIASCITGIIIGVASFIAVDNGALWERFLIDLERIVITLWKIWMGIKYLFHIRR